MQCCFRFHSRYLTTYFKDVDRPWWEPCPDCQSREVDLHRKDLIARDVDIAEWALELTYKMIKVIKVIEERAKNELLLEMQRTGQIKSGGRLSPSSQPNDSPPPYITEVKNCT